MDWGAGRPEGSEQVLTGTLLLHLGGESCVGYSATRSFVVASVSLTQQHLMCDFFCYQDVTKPSKSNG